MACHFGPAIAASCSTVTRCRSMSGLALLLIMLGVWRGEGAGGQLSPVGGWCLVSARAWGIVANIR